MVSKIEQGRSGENLACRYLQAQGLTLVERNFRCKCGELDLIMRDGPHLVFVEVRYRRDSRRGAPAETVTGGKRRRIIKTASYYLQRHPCDLPCRFDIIAITQREGRDALEWIKDAFQAL